MPVLLAAAAVIAEPAAGAEMMAVAMNAFDASVSLLFSVRRFRSSSSFCSF
jgi:hypothetical protein